MLEAIQKTYWTLMRALRTQTGPKDPAILFSSIYREAVWGVEDDFNSGTGSRDKSVVDPYVAAARSYLEEVGGPIKIVDVGCGDFNVGRQIISHAAEYVGCDIVPELIERNRRLFSAPNLRFEIVNAIDDDLP